MRDAIVKVLLGIGVVAIAASGCSDSKTGTPSPAPNSTNEPTSTVTSTPMNGAPRVADPLDGTKFLTEPCAVLTAPQLQALNLPGPGKPDTDSAVAKSSGPGCTWSNRDARSGVGIGFLSGNKNGLSDTYRGRDRFKGYFEPTEVDGYPAVFNDPSDFRTNGSCNITVGISDALAFLASEDGQLGAKSCDHVKQVASMMIQTIRSGG